MSQMRNAERRAQNEPKLTSIKEEADELTAITVASIKLAGHNRAFDAVIRIPDSASR